MNKDRSAHSMDWLSPVVRAKSGLASQTGVQWSTQLAPWFNTYWKSKKKCWRKLLHACPIYKQLPPSGQSEYITGHVLAIITLPAWLRHSLYTLNQSRHLTWPNLCRQSARRAWVSNCRCEDPIIDWIKRKALQTEDDRRAFARVIHALALHHSSISSDVKPFWHWECESVSRALQG